jgi:hypothetical protein
MSVAMDRKIIPSVKSKVVLTVSLNPILIESPQNDRTTIQKAKKIKSHVFFMIYTSFLSESTPTLQNM